MVKPFKTLCTHQTPKAHAKVRCKGKERKREREREIQRVSQGEVDRGK